MTLFLIRKYYRIGFFYKQQRSFHYLVYSGRSITFCGDSIFRKNIRTNKIFESEKPKEHFNAIFRRYRRPFFHKTRLRLDFYCFNCLCRDFIRLFVICQNLYCGVKQTNDKIFEIFRRSMKYFIDLKNYVVYFEL